MKNVTRKDFMRTTASLASFGLLGISFNTTKQKPLLSFSTLGCPDWSLMKIIEFAAKHKYQGIELRGIQREMDLTKCKEFNNQESIDSILIRMRDNGLRFVDLGSSAVLHISDNLSRTKNLDEAKRFIDLAQKLNCPFVRVFPDKLPKERSHEFNLEIIQRGLDELGEYANGSAVMVLMETHGELINSSDIEKVMQSCKSSHVGIIWDIVNMWAVTKESPEKVFQKLKKYILHVHIKDAKMEQEKEQYTLIGEGEAPILEAIDLLFQNEFKGFYSFEWEKLWHPDLPEPELALADYSKKMSKKYG